MPQGIGCLDEVDSYNNHIRVFDQKAGGMILDCNNGLCGGASWPKCKLVYETKSGWRSLMRWINILVCSQQTVFVQTFLKLSNPCLLISVWYNCSQSEMPRWELVKSGSCRL
jgi:hypothetical protein